jgi:hypothetical protein
MGNREVHTRFWLGDLREKSHLEELNVGVNIILKWISKKWDVAAWTGLLRLRITRGRAAPVNAVMNIQVP